MDISGLQGNGYNQVVDRFGWVNVKDFGAIGDGVHDDTAALQAAWGMMGIPAGGTFYVPNGLYKVSTTLLFDGGYTGAGNPGSNAWTGRSVSIISEGSFDLASGIGIGIHCRAMYNPHIQIKLSGGGESTDNGVQISDMLGLFIDVMALGFGGTALYYNGTETANSRVVMVNGGKIITLDSGAALSLKNGSAGGFGVIDSVWDNNPSSGSILSNINDVSILHYENYVNGLAGAGLTITGCNAIHLGKIALGDNSTPLLQIEDSGNEVPVAIDELYLLGEGASSQISGLEQSDSVVNIGLVETNGLAAGLQIVSGNLLMSNHVDYGSSTALAIGAGPSRISIANAHYSESVAYAIGGGPNNATAEINIGYLRTTNCVSSSDYPVVNIVSAGTLFLVHEWTDDSPDATYALTIPNGYQVVETRNYRLHAKGINYSTQGQLTPLAGTDGGNVYWSQNIDRTGVVKKLLAYFDAYENNSTTNQIITFPMTYIYPPVITTNTTGLTITVTTTTLTITAPDVTTTYSGVVEVVGI